MTLEQVILEKLAHADAMSEKLAPKTTGANPRPPEPEWADTKRKANPWYEVVFQDELLGDEVEIPEELFCNT